MRVAILAVGDEFVAGESQDTNSPWLARQVRARGHRVAGFAVVGDDVGAVRRAVEQARGGGVDLLLVTGGLGPTADDLTRDGVAAALGLPLEERAELIAELEAWSVRSRRPLSAGSRRQAEMPAGAQVLANPLGTAPGFLVTASPRAAGRPGATASGAASGAAASVAAASGVAASGKSASGAAPPVAARGFAVVCLPGVPSEMRAMAETLFDRLLPRGEAFTTRSLLLCGLTEAALGERLGDLMHHAAGERDDARLGITARAGILSVSLRGRDPAALAAMEALVRERAGDALFGEGEETLAGAVVRGLAARGLSVSVAESCTGGLLSAAITSVPGSSEVFREGVVTYSDEAKAERLGVPRELLERHGAVSEPVAAAMARGQRLRAGADLALGVSGLAGPGGGRPGTPVGTVVIALDDRAREAAGEPPAVVTHAWRGSRDELRARSATMALDMLRRRLGAL